VGRAALADDAASLPDALRGRRYRCPTEARQQRECVAVDVADPRRHDAQTEELRDHHPVLSGVADRWLAAGADVDEDPAVLVARPGVELGPRPEPSLATRGFEELVQALESPLDVVEVAAAVLTSTPADLLEHVLDRSGLLPAHAVAPVREREANVNVLLERNRIDRRPAIDDAARPHRETAERDADVGGVDPKALVRPWRGPAEADDVRNPPSLVASAAYGRGLDDSADHLLTLASHSWGSSWTLSR
jgi:hypothetical protein